MAAAKLAEKAQGDKLTDLQGLLNVIVGEENIMAESLNALDQKSAVVQELVLKHMRHSKSTKFEISFPDIDDAAILQAWAIKVLDKTATECESFDTAFDGISLNECIACCGNV